MLSKQGMATLAKIAQKTRNYSREDILADLVLLLAETSKIEHEQDYKLITAIRKRYGVSL